MCGIAGIFGYKDTAPAVDRKELLNIRDYMTKRGPDGQGQWFSEDERVGLVHRRLSIIDLSDRGAQPMLDPLTGSVITYNGEIYNYKELRENLKARGCMFESESDTEVILHLYRERGPDMVHELRGMFAFAIWEPRHKRLFCARDPYGIKPLYYADDGGTLRLASQVKAIFAGGRVSTTVSVAGKVGFYLWGSVPEPWTWFEAIRELPAGHTLTAERDGAVNVERYDSLDRAWCGPITSDTVPLETALKESVAAHLVADVPVGLFLSSGIDSGALLALMKELGVQSLQCTTLGFDEFAKRTDDETTLAGELAVMYGADHRVARYTPHDIEALMPRFLSAMDQPSIDGLNTWLVSRAAAQQGRKVAMSGLGGDELLGGYPSFTDLPRWVNRWKGLRSLSRLAEKPGRLMGLASRLPGPPKAWAMPVLGGHWASAYLLRRGIFMPWELTRFMKQDEVEEGLSELRPLQTVNAALGAYRDAGSNAITAFARVALMESGLYLRNQLLRDADWAGMDHSIEIRTPLVDRKLLGQVAGRIMAGGDAGMSKAALANAPRRGLPESIRGRPKTGFFLPMDRWVQLPSLKALWAGDASLARSSCHWSRRWLHAVSNGYSAT